MLQAGDNNFVARFHIVAAPALRNQVDAFGGSTNEDYLLRGSRVQKSLHLDACLFVSLGRPLAKLMHAAVDIGAIHFVELHDGVDDGARFLRGSGIIEVDERLAVNGLLEDGEILADPLDVESGMDRASYRAHEISQTTCAPANRGATGS